MKKGVILGLILFALGLPLTSVSKDLGAALCMIGIVVAFVSLFRWKKKKAPEPQKEPDPVPTPVPVAPAPATLTETHRVAGVSYHHEEIEAVGDPNPDYDLSASEAYEMYCDGDRIFEYVFFATPKLVQEPDNPHDKNAIRVEANGECIGHIKAGSCSHVRKLMDEGRIISMELEIAGGKFKRLEVSDNDRPKLTKDSTEYHAVLTLKVKPEAQ